MSFQRKRVFLERKGAAEICESQQIPILATATFIYSSILIVNWYLSKLISLKYYFVRHKLVYWGNWSKQSYDSSGPQL